MADSLSTLLAISVTVVLVRPRHVPTIAHAAGRALGLTVRALNHAKRYADDAVAQSSRVTTANPHLADVQRNIESSVSEFTSFAHTLRKDMQDVPLNPATYIRSQFRKAARAKGATGDLNEAVRTPAQATPAHSPTPAPQTTLSALRSAPLQNNPASTASTPRRPNHPLHLARVTTGADLLAQSIQEAALAHQQQKLFPSSKPSDPAHTHLTNSS